MKRLFLSLLLISSIAFGDDPPVPKPSIEGVPTALADQIAIPSGKYAVGEKAELIELPAFEIDRFEVSIGRYAKFIEWCESNPADEHKFDHPKSPRHLSHAAQDVTILIKNARVRGGRVFKNLAQDESGAAIDLNSPIVGVSWWDAYAFAKWEGKTVRGGEDRDLPTDIEWEVAARGPAGLKFPWGDVSDAGKTNSGADYTLLKPGAAAAIDGYNYWAPVDKLASDISPMKVEGMGGNVAEWVYRKSDSKEIAVLKGGSFASGPTEMSQNTTTLPAEDCWFVYPRSDKASASPVGPDFERFFVGDALTQRTRALYIGFRTVRRK